MKKFLVLFLFALCHAHCCLSMRFSLRLQSKPKTSRLRLTSQALALLRARRQLAECQRMVRLQATIIKQCKARERQFLLDYRIFIKDIQRERARANFYQQWIKKEVSRFISDTDFAEL